MYKRGFSHLLEKINNRKDATMIVVKLQGGLGNQMFQYAAGKSLSLKWGKPLFLDISVVDAYTPNVDKRQYALPIFEKINTPLSSSFFSGSFFMPHRWDNRIRKILGGPLRKVLNENTHSFNESFNTIQPPVLIDGYWQSEKYFKPYEAAIRNDFEFPPLLSTDANREIMQDMESHVAVSVHVRRGDYVKYGTENKFFGLCEVPYYQQAIDWLLSRKTGLKFYFFSEDADWVEANLMRPGLNAAIVKGNLHEDSWKDMFLMSRCQHHILANSSFSWWGAWLNPSKEKTVIVPSKWFNTDDPYFEPNDVVPENWVRI
jgi:hypothetical protein